MEDAFMNFALATAARDEAFTELTTKNGNLSTQLRQQEDQIWALQAKLCNLNVAAATWSIDVKTNKTGQPYARDKKQKPQWTTDLTENTYNNRDYCWFHVYKTSDPHMSEKCMRVNVGHMKSATWGDPMGGSQNNKARLWNKWWKRGGGYVKKIVQ